MKYLTEIVNYVKPVWQNRVVRNFLLIIIASLLFLKQCDRISNLKQDVNQAEELANRNFNNYKAAIDTVKKIELDNGKQAATIRSYEFDISKLEDNQKKLINKYRNTLNINKDLNKVNSLLHTEIKIKDSLLANLSITAIDSLTDVVKFSKFDDFGSGNTRLLEGKMVVYKDSNGILYRDPSFTIEQSVTLFASIEELNGNKSIKITTDYPGLSIMDIENINLINTKLNQRAEKAAKTAGWSLGIGVSYGLNLNNNQVISYGPSLGVGLFWSPKWLRF